MKWIFKKTFLFVTNHFQVAFRFMCHSLAPRGPSPVKRTRGGCIRGQDAGRWWMLSTRCVERASERFSSLMPRNQLISNKALKRVCVCVCVACSKRTSTKTRTKDVLIPPDFSRLRLGSRLPPSGCLRGSASHTLLDFFGARLCISVSRTPPRRSIRTVKY